MRGPARLAALALVLVPAVVMADRWHFEPPIEVTSVAGGQVFHHLESSGRRNVAVSGGVVAVAWEDDRDGTPRVYLARKGLDDDAFADEQRVSGAGEAYEPSLVALGAGRFALAWEEDGQVHARVVDGPRLGPVFRAANADSVQASLAAAGGTLLLVAAERDGRFPRIHAHRLAVGPDLALTAAEHCPVDGVAPRDEQLYPAAIVLAGRVVVAWEDRRPGHTIIMAASSPAGAVCQFAPAQRISQRDGSGNGMGRNMPYGKGHGVSRVALAAFGSSSAFAAWADKRNFREGYDIWGAPWTAADGFGANERVQDDFGGVAQQWHATAAGHPDGTLVVAWDDERDGSPSVVMSWREDGTWSDDVVLPGAGGPGEQANPSIVLDADGNLHTAWVEREVTGGPTRLRYAFGRARD
ncbi:MAG TPA: hypothetical protein ENN87_10200 [Phycisphaerales bacterium]|nr:hypothetical protein [Phycisphaerales bacterium]